MCQPSDIAAAEQVTERLPPEHRPPPSALILRPIVDHVATLAEGREVAVSVVRGVVIPVSSGQQDLCLAGLPEDVRPYADPDPTASAIAPPAGLRVPPAAIAEVVDHSPVRPSAALAAASRPAEPDHGRELRPIDRIEEAVLGPDWHGGALCHQK